MKLTILACPLVIIIITLARLIYFKYTKEEDFNEVKHYHYTTYMAMSYKRTNDQGL